MKEYKLHSIVVEVICNLKGSEMTVFGGVFESGSDLLTPTYNDGAEVYVRFLYAKNCIFHNPYSKRLRNAKNLKVICG